MASLAHRETSGRTSANNRSRVSNGRRLFAETDGRSVWGRRYRDLIELHCEDLGGAPCLSEAQRSLIRRAAALTVEIERLEGRMANGEDIDLDTFGRLSGHLRRIRETIGLQRRSRDVTPSLAEIIRRHNTEDEDTSP